MRQRTALLLAIAVGTLLAVVVAGDDSAGTDGADKLHREHRAFYPWAGKRSAGETE
jgi:hypothetical protein